MDDKSKQILQGILSLSPGQLTQEQSEFLRARRMYLNDEQYRVFQSVLPEDDRPKKNVGNTYRNPTPTQYTNPEADGKGATTEDDEMEVEIRTGDQVPSPETPNEESNPYNKGNADPDKQK